MDNIKKGFYWVYHIYRKEWTIFKYDGKHWNRFGDDENADYIINHYCKLGDKIPIPTEK